MGDSASLLSFRVADVYFMLLGSPSFMLGGCLVRNGWPSLVSRQLPPSDTNAALGVHVLAYWSPARFPEENVLSRAVDGKGETAGACGAPASSTHGAGELKSEKRTRKCFCSFFRTPLPRGARPSSSFPFPPLSFPFFRFLFFPRF